MNNLNRAHARINNMTAVFHRQPRCLFLKDRKLCVPTSRWVCPLQDINSNDDFSSDLNVETKNISFTYQ